MAFQPGKNAAVFAAQFDFSGDLTQYQFASSRQTVNVTTMGNDDKVFLAGVAEGRISVQGVWNPAADRTDEEINAFDGVFVPITASPQGATAIGNRAHMIYGLIENYQPRAPNNDAVRFSSGVQASAGAWKGVILHPNQAETAPANFASVDGGAQTTTGAAAFLHVLAFSGTDATVTIEDSADNSIFGSLAAFSQVTGLTSERLAITGTVERYVRVALTGTFTSITFVVSFARHLL